MFRFTISAMMTMIFISCSQLPQDAASSNGLPTSSQQTTSSSSRSSVSFSFPALDPVPANSFTLVHLSDTQYYTSSYKTGKPLYFQRAVAWIAAQMTNLNIVFVSHTGDVVDQGCKTNQYTIATNAMAAIEGLLPHGYAWGNHEYYNSSWVIDKNQRLYNQYFPLSKYTSYSWWGSSYPAGAMDNSCQLFSASGLDFMMLNLNYDPSDAEIAWANTVLAANQNKRVILGNHKYMDTVALDSIGEKIFSRVVMSNTNIFMVLCGHYGGENYLLTNNIAGQPVHQLLADYQHLTNGGSGYLRTLTFIPDSNIIQVSTYCTMSNYYEVDSNSRFDIPYDMTL